MSDEAHHLIASVLRDYARVPAPPRLRRKLEQRYLGLERRWVLPASTAVAGASLAAVAALVVRPVPAPASEVAMEAVGDHLRMLGGSGLDVVSNDMHNVKPWFAGKLDFVPPVAVLGDDELQLLGGDVAVFLGHKAAELVYGRQLHRISLFVFESTDATAGERTIQGFHVVTWGAAGLGFALVSDVSWDDLRTLRLKLE